MAKKKKKVKENKVIANDTVDAILANNIANIMQDTIKNVTMDEEKVYDPNKNFDVTIDIERYVKVIKDALQQQAHLLTSGDDTSDVFNEKIDILKWQMVPWNDFVRSGMLWYVNRVIEPLGFSLKVYKGKEYHTAVVVPFELREDVKIRDDEIAYKSSKFALYVIERLKRLFKRA
jgi:hypothetical protein